MKNATFWEKSVYVIVLTAMSLSALTYLLTVFTEDTLRARRTTSRADVAE